MPEVVFECPRCKAGGLRQLCCIDIVLGQPRVTCRGCESWDDDPQRTVSLLGYDPDEGDPPEVVLRVFDLLWAMHRSEGAA
jgi:hypothetical protein